MPPDNDNEAIGALVAQLAQLKQSYERYWQGLERPEPERERLALRAAFTRLRSEVDAQTHVAAQFRLRSAHQSFLAFDQLCERRLRAQLSTRAPMARPTDARPAAALALTTRRETDALYAQLQTALAARGLPAPSADKFRRQLEACLTAAQAQAPGRPLRAQLHFDAAHRVSLVVLPATSAEAKRPI